jgi:hypothetical protein
VAQLVRMHMIEAGRSGDTGDDTSHDAGRVAARRAASDRRRVDAR